MMKGALALFMSLTIGYVLCILAEKQKDILKTLGYTLGISILVLTLLFSAMESLTRYCMYGKSICGIRAMKCAGVNFMKGHHK